ncbi:MAG: putative ribosomally synthesized peptide with SipW-like signal peptide [Halobacteriales archaeon]|jgi:predicted ribosomally synthesized peptide with SipW-like signal peptide
MTEKNTIDLSRRKVLAGLGTIGLASAGAGLGTSAYFSDVETFENNTLTAGSLDLVVDWEEHYYMGALADGIRLLYSEPTGDDADMYVGFPDPVNPQVYVHADDIDAFMDSTSLEAYPDAGVNGSGDSDDGIQDDIDFAYYQACEDFAQLDANLDPTNGRGDGKRTANEDTILNYDAWLEGEGSVDPVIAPLVNLHDVKPGDFGELTLSMHLCDNPGYIWLQGELGEALENGHTEPEANDPDEIGSPESTNPDEVELLDEIQTLLWYDEDGDNVFEPGAEGGGDADVVIVMDTSGSMSGSKIANAKTGAKSLVDAVGPDVRIALVGFDDQEYLAQELTSDKTVIKGAIDALGTGGSTNIEGGLNGARDILSGTDVSAEVDPNTLGDSNTPNITVLLSDGSPNVDDDGDGSDDPVDEATALKGDGVELYTIAYGVSAGSSLAQLMEDMASTPKEQYAYLASDIDEAEAIFAQIGQILAGEEAFFRGTLRELLATVGTDYGIPLDGIRESPFDELADPANDPARDPFVDSTTNALGLAWWLPVDHANEIQTDSVTFDLGFYTEQARHNDGSGQAPEMTTTAPQ